MPDFAENDLIASIAQPGMFCIAVNRGLNPISCRGMVERRKNLARNPVAGLWKRFMKKDYIAYESYSRPGVTEYVHVDSVIPENHGNFCHDKDCLTHDPPKYDYDDPPRAATPTNPTIQTPENVEQPPKPRLGFLDLPPELRNKIYDLLNTTTPPFSPDRLPSTHTGPIDLIPLQHTCKALYAELQTLITAQTIILALHTMRLSFWSTLPPHCLSSFRSVLLTQNYMLETPSHKYAGWRTGTYDHVLSSLCSKGFRPSTLVFVTDVTHHRDTPSYVALAMRTSLSSAVKDLALALAILTSVERIIIVDACPTVACAAEGEQQNWRGRGFPWDCSRRFGGHEDPMDQEGFVWRWGRELHDSGEGRKVSWKGSKGREVRVGFEWRGNVLEKGQEVGDPGRREGREWEMGVRIWREGSKAKEEERSIRVRFFSDWREFCGADSGLWFGEGWEARGDAARIDSEGHGSHPQGMYSVCSYCGY